MEASLSVWKIEMQCPWQREVAIAPSCCLSFECKLEGFMLSLVVRQVLLGAYDLIFDQIQSSYAGEV